ncbi:aminotransferase class III-fold pyridoxal phosphate-dependent enzyme [Actinomadura atramentaria]|uniref:aminotransferase class III-fold pyridoxal phosphate-dependent enzyme n=1 Tax=Actinomadura atramentaria TaxID=1990 RepID=UPI00036B0935|nr:aminotransferase class III-fold pyridoxal phosphate-dependent enzyme [Actinomadura atramentaria]
MIGTSRTIPDGLIAGDLVYRTPPDARFVGGDGVRLYDDTGREYLDAEAANGAAAFGYDRTLLAEAALRAAELPAVPSFCESELRLRVTRRLAALFDSVVGVPGRVACDLGGAQGIEMALRVVAANRGSGPILAFQGGYHGRSPFTAHLSASARYRAVQPWPGPEVVRLPYPDCGTCSFRPAGGGCNPACSAAVQRLGADDLFGLPGAAAERGVAALILEPMLNVGGCVLPDSGHVRRVVEHVRSLGGLIVVDEIFTGMHRLGPRWGFELHGIEPDIVVASKALTNGITPLSCVWAREPLADPAVVPPGSHSSTFAGNQFSLAVAETVLDRFDGLRQPAAVVEALGARLAAELEPLRERAAVADVVVAGAVARVELTGPHAARVRALAAGPGRPRGLLLASTGMAPATVILHPPLTTTAEEVRSMAGLLADALNELERER